MNKKLSPVYKKQLDIDQVIEGQTEIPVTNFLSFPEAMKLVIEGKQITKIEWHNDNVFGVLKDGFLMIHTADDKFHRWIINDGDLLGNDYVVL
jgi:hypothetical protein